MWEDRRCHLIKWTYKHYKACYLLTSQADVQIPWNVWLANERPESSKSASGSWWVMDKDIHSSSSAFGKGGLGLCKSIPSLFLLTLLLHLFRRHLWLVKFVSHHRVRTEAAHAFCSSSSCCVSFCCGRWRNESLWSNSHVHTTVTSKRRSVLNPDLSWVQFLLLFHKQLGRHR